MSDIRAEHASDDELHALLDGELDVRRGELLAAHLPSCAGCAGRLERLKALFTRIESIPEVAFEGDLSSQVLRALPSASHRLPRLAALETALTAALLVLAIPWLAATEWSTGLSQALQGWVGTAAQALTWQAFELPSQIYGLLGGIQSLTGPGLAHRFPSIPAAQLWLLAGSAALLCAVGNGLLLRRSSIQREERP